MDDKVNLPTIRYFTGTFFSLRYSVNVSRKIHHWYLSSQWLESHGLNVYVDIFDFDKGSPSDSMFLLQISKSANSI